MPYNELSPHLTRGKTFRRVLPHSEAQRKRAALTVEISKTGFHGEDFSPTYTPYFLHVRRQWRRKPKSIAKSSQVNHGRRR